MSHVTIRVDDDEATVRDGTWTSENAWLQRFATERCEGVTILTDQPFPDFALATLVANALNGTIVDATYDGIVDDDSNLVY